MFKPAVRTINDIARNLCHLSAQQAGGEEALGMSPEDWCVIRKNLDPFIREVTSAQAAASNASGLSPTP